MSLTNILSAATTVSVVAGGSSLIYLYTTNSNKTTQHSSPSAEELKQQIEEATKKNSVISQKKEELEKHIAKELQMTLNIESLAQQIADTTLDIEKWKDLIINSDKKIKDFELLHAPIKLEIENAKNTHTTQEGRVEEAKNKVSSYEITVTTASDSWNKALSRKHTSDIELSKHTTGLSRSARELQGILDSVNKITGEKNDSKDKEAQKQKEIDAKNIEINKQEENIKNAINTYLSTIATPTDGTKQQDKIYLDAQLNDLGGNSYESISDATLKTSIKDQVESLKTLKTNINDLNNSLTEIKEKTTKAESDLRLEQQKYSSIDATTKSLAANTTNINDASTRASQEYVQKKQELEAARKQQLDYKLSVVAEQQTLAINKSSWDQAKEKEQRLLSQIAIETQNKQDLEQKQTESEELLKQQRAQKQDTEQQLIIHKQTIAQKQQEIDLL